MTQQAHSVSANHFEANEPSLMMSERDSDVFHACKGNLAMCSRVCGFGVREVRHGMQRWNGQASTCRSDMVASLGLLQALNNLPPKTVSQRRREIRC